MIFVNIRPPYPPVPELTPIYSQFPCHVPCSCPCDSPSLVLSELAEMSELTAAGASSDIFDGVSSCPINISQPLELKVVR